MKVVTYNIHKGWSLFSRRFVLSELKNELETLDADLVLLQEIKGQSQEALKLTSDSETDAQFEFLADRLWPHHAYGKNAITQGGHHGNAILSKHPFTSWENINVSPFKNASRSLLHGIIEYNENKIHVITVHLGLFEWERKKQIQTLIDRIKEEIPENEALIIGGDFNDWRRLAHKKIRAELNLTEAYEDSHGALAKSFPSFMPFIHLDRIYFRGLRLIQCEKLKSSPWSKLSDHTPLYVEFEI